MRWCFEQVTCTAGLYGSSFAYTAVPRYASMVLLLVCYRPLARTTRREVAPGRRHGTQARAWVWLISSFASRLFSGLTMGKKSRRQREKDPGSGLRKVLSAGPATETTGRAFGDASVGAAESNMLFRNRESGFAAGATRRDTAMRRAKPRTGPNTNRSAWKK